MGHESQDVIVLITLELEKPGTDGPQEYYVYLAIEPGKLKAFEDAYKIAIKSGTDLDLTYFVSKLIASGPLHELTQARRQEIEKPFADDQFHDLSPPREPDAAGPSLRQREGLDI